MKFLGQRKKRSNKEENEKSCKYLNVALQTMCLLVLVSLHVRRSPLQSIEKQTSESPPAQIEEVADRQSYGLLKNVTAEDWEVIRKKVHEQSIFANPGNPLEKVEDSDYWITNNIFPNFDCPNNTAMGGAPEKDGVKFVCNPQGLIQENDDGDDSKSTCLVYSIGCAGNYVFEDSLYEMHQGKCEIHVFDPAPNWGRQGDPEKKNIHYHAWGFLSTYDTQSRSNVWPKGRGGGFKTFPETLKELGHEDRVIDIFKIDCEGCEWSTYKDWIGRGFRQILVENHGVPTPTGVSRSRWFQMNLNIQEYYDSYKEHGYALFNRDFHGKAVDLAFVKLTEDFWRNSTKTF